MTTILKFFEKWKQFLHERVTEAEKAGISDEMIDKLAYHVGDFLAKQIDPQNDQERILKDLWDVATIDEQKTIAKLMVKLVN